MSARSLARFVGAAIVAAAIPLVLPTQPASAATCPDVEVIFARGTSEPPGLGVTGTSFVESVRLLAVGRSVGSYAVNYQASNNFNDPIALAGTVLDGIRDEQAHVEYMAANCANTRLVLGGYSQGAALTGYATMSGTPAAVPTEYAADWPAPLPPAVSNQVAAVVLFGKPSDRWLRDAGAPPAIVGPLYAGKNTELCIGGDTICDGSGVGQPNALHGLYAFNGMALGAAGFVVSRL
ncbi:cutinase family protein [Antrihabitans cavernicola]|uniref:Cutinase family protein n=1 Tax=Antrihabitans cavernicola TaxID=2495913 RepID=A0A5A7SH39_9NOCA|nr:cutinase family protein [Spelaeibacter cavernicola]KAA0024709.1 cutinase family protein [Spelaeibacter cavernicola]